jgi:hypothetical protein
MGQNKFHKLQRPADLTFALCCLGAFLTETFLAYRQILLYSGKYQSDLSLHINIVRSGRGNYRMINFLVNMMDRITTNPWAIAVVMGLLVMSTLIANYVLIRYFTRRFTESRISSEIMAVLALYTGPIYIPKYMPYFYAKTQSKYAWQNPTQIMVTVFSVLALWVFYKVYERYMERITAWGWLLLAVAFLLSAWAKPSFIMEFFPAAAMVMLVDLFSKRRFCNASGMLPEDALVIGSADGQGVPSKNSAGDFGLQTCPMTNSDTLDTANGQGVPSKNIADDLCLETSPMTNSSSGDTCNRSAASEARSSNTGFTHRLRQVFILGMTMLPACIYFLMLNSTLFGSSAQEASNEAGKEVSKVVIQLGRAYFHQDFSVTLSIIAGLAFPLFVLLFNLRELKKPEYAVGWLTVLWGYAIHFTFSETGPRATHGNFAWGKKVAIYLIFAISMAKFLENLYNPDFLQGKKSRKVAYGIIGSLLLTLHLVSQLIYLVHVGHGGRYMI